jgi:uncharacterized protein (UPF0335 family)
MSLGRNSVSGRELQAFVERIERLRTEKKALGADEAMVMAELGAAGFAPKIVRAIVKRRAAKPHDLQEEEALAETYMHALGMKSDTPLFRHVGLMSVDPSQREQVIEAMKAFVPIGGSITITTPSGLPIQLSRSESGDVTAIDVQPPKTPKERAPAPGASRGSPTRLEPQGVDADGAEAMGRAAFRANSPIVANPFPFGDSRRACWDRGWRDESGSDGLGPDD